MPLRAQDSGCESCAGSPSLEENWGLAPSGYMRDVWPQVRYQIFGFDVSADEKYIVYLAGRQSAPLTVLLKNLESGAVTKLSVAGLWPQFSPDSKYVAFKIARDSIAVYSIYDGTYDVVSPIIECAGSAPWCIEYLEWAPDSFLYAGLCGGSVAETVYYRFDLLKFPEVKCEAWTLIDQDAYPLYFPPDDRGWAAARSYRSIENVEGVPGGFDTVGFVVTSNIMGGRPFYREKSVVRDRIDGIQSDWHFSQFGEVSLGFFPSAQSVAPASCGAVYVHLGVRSVEELVPPVDGPREWYSEEELGARSLSGWYRADTGEGSAIQVTRSWNNYGAIVGKLSGSLYYVRERDDSTLTIMRTDECGYGREVVVNMEDDPTISAVIRPQHAEIRAVKQLVIEVGRGAISIDCDKCYSGRAMIEIFSMTGELVASEALVLTPSGVGVHGYLSPIVTKGLYLIRVSQRDQEIGRAIVFLSDK